MVKQINDNHVFDKLAYDLASGLCPIYGINLFNVHGFDSNEVTCKFVLDIDYKIYENDVVLIAKSDLIFYETVGLNLDIDMTEQYMKGLEIHELKRNRSVQYPYFDHYSIEVLLFSNRNCITFMAKSFKLHVKESFKICDPNQINRLYLDDQ